MTLSECAEALSKGPVTKDQAACVLKEFADTLTPEANALVSSLSRMWSRDAAWCFSLPGGMVAKVTFSAEPERRHIEAFQKVFNSMAEAWLGTEA